ncbi:MAG: site-2 protease family protein [Candidatus Hodarchaeales archaeon]
MLKDPFNLIFPQIDEIITSLFTVTSFSYRTPRTKNSAQVMVLPTYEILRRSDLSTNMKKVTKELKKLGYIPFLRAHPIEESRGLLLIIPINQKMLDTKQNFTTPLILFVLTLLSVIFSGIKIWQILRKVEPNLNLIITTAFYLIGIIGIIGIHEIGHIIASKLHGIQASLPYFIPNPFSFGTFGAFITQKTPTKSRDALFDVGLAGPIFGFVVALFFTVIGLFLSFPVPATAVPTEFGSNIFFMDFTLSSATRYRVPLFELIALLIFPQRNPNTEIVLHPLALAGYIGLLLTGLNLIPIGQTDGGHVARSLVSEKNHRMITYISAGLLTLLGFFFFAILLLLMYSQTGHPGPLDDISDVSNTRKVLAVSAIILGILCLPIPVEIYNWIQIIVF